MTDEEPQRMTGHIEGNIDVSTVIDELQVHGAHKHARSLGLAVIAGAFLLAVVLGVSTLSGVFSRTADNAAFAEAIQKERARATLENCQMQNARNRNTVAQVRKRYRSLPPAERRAGRDNRDYTIALIQALAPMRNCDRVVERAVRLEPLD
jgi:hypothetical protein